MSKKSKIEINNFYDIYAGGKHTSYIYLHNKNRKSYTSLKFGTTQNKDMVEIEPIDGKRVKYVHNRPFEGKRSDYGNRKLKGLAISAKDNETVEEIKKRKPHKTAKLKKYFK